MLNNILIGTIGILAIASLTLSAVFILSRIFKIKKIQRFEARMSGAEQAIVHAVSEPIKKAVKSIASVVKGKVIAG
jgi:hypothetical protein